MTITKSSPQTQNPWDAVASGYDAFVTPSHFWLGAETVRRAGLRPGMRFLDVAAGSGGLSLPAARAGAQVLATDLSPRMLERLAARAREEGLTNVEVRAMDGHALELEDETFDVVGSQFGVMLFPDMPRGIREMARVARRGGRVAIAAFGPPADVEFLGVFVRAVRRVQPEFEGPLGEPPPLPFQLREQARFREELASAGLTSVRIDTVSERLEFRTGEEFRLWLFGSNPIVGSLVAALGLDERQLAVVHEALEDEIRERAGGTGPAVLTHPVHIGVGVK